MKERKKYADLREFYKNERFVSRGPIYDEERTLGLIGYILNARQENMNFLVQLAGSQNCESVFRCAAIHRLFQLNKKQPEMQIVKTFGNLAYNQSDTDENLRVRAYEAYLYLRQIGKMPLNSNEKDMEKLLAEKETSGRMKWLLLME